jgi:hypothetical protein
MLKILPELKAVIMRKISKWALTRLFKNSFFFFLMGLGFELRAWCLLAKQALYHLSHNSSLFYSGYFGGAVL